MPKRYSKSTARARREVGQNIAQLVVSPGGVWTVASVETEPSIVLTDWHIFELQIPGDATRTRYFAGSTGSWGEGRVSTAIKEFDPITMRGVTESGRVYQLTSRRGFTGDGEYVWNQWCRIRSAADVVDVSAEVGDKNA